MSKGDELRSLKIFFDKYLFNGALNWIVMCTTTVKGNMSAFTKVNYNSTKGG